MHSTLLALCYPQHLILFELVSFYHFPPFFLDMGLHFIIEIIDLLCIYFFHHEHDTFLTFWLLFIKGWANFLSNLNNYSFIAFWTCYYPFNIFCHLYSLVVFNLAMFFFISLHWAGLSTWLFILLNLILKSSFLMYQVFLQLGLLSILSSFSFLPFYLLINFVLIGSFADAL